MENPYAPPGSHIAPPPPVDRPVEYADFWSRLAAMLLDGIIIAAITIPLTLLAYGSDSMSDSRFIKGPADIVISYIFPAVWSIVFWVTKGATPGKMALRIRIVSADGRPVGATQSIVRYIGYYLSMIGLFLGYLWVIWDPRKQGWHDKMARTVVIRIRP